MSYSAAFLCDGHYKQVVTLMVVLCTLPDVAIIPQFDARATIDSHKAEIEEAPIGDPEEPLGLAASMMGKVRGLPTMAMALLTTSSVVPVTYGPTPNRIILHPPVVMAARSWGPVTGLHTPPPACILSAKLVDTPV